MKTAAAGRTARRRGYLAEALCVLSLRLRGYRILARDLRTAARGSGVGEIDIVARRGRTLAFVEVKARPDRATALEALRPSQQARIERGARLFLARHPDLAVLDMRFDLMTVRPWRWPHHLADAWRPD